MKINYYNQKRQSGKTTDLVNLFLAKPEKTLFITVNQHMVDLIKSKIPHEYWKHIKSAESARLICGYSYDRILIDEYDFIKNKNDFFYNILHLLNTFNGEITIKTTPSKQYKKENYVIAKLLKRHSSESILKYLNMLGGDDRLEVDELLDSIITHDTTELFDTSVINYDNSWHTRAERTGEMFI